MAECVSPVFEENRGGQRILEGGETGANPLPIYPWQNEGEVPFMISKWKLTDEELEQVKKTGCVYLLVMGTCHPPVQVHGHMFLGDDSKTPMIMRLEDPLERMMRNDSSDPDKA